MIGAERVGMNEGASALLPDSQRRTLLQRWKKKNI